MTHLSLPKTPAPTRSAANPESESPRPLQSQQQTASAARCAILRNADWIVVDEMKKSDWYYKVWQSFAVLLPVRSVGVQGDERTYDFTCALRMVESQDGMTADWVRLPYEILKRIASRITNEVKGINRVCLDITSKTPATIGRE